MTTYTFKCEVQEPLILFKKQKTEQTTESLDYIPGNTFRGIIANNLFKEKADEKDIDNIIFNSTVQFGDAHLLIDGKRSFKTPATFHQNSGDKEDVVNSHLSNTSNTSVK